jgi:hypothetical protein
MAQRGGTDIDLGFDPKSARDNLVDELSKHGVLSRQTLEEWRTQARERARVAIDIDAERRRLSESGIVDEALIEQLAQHWVVENARRENLSEEDVEWEVARQAGDVHALLHGVRVRINGENAPHCEEWPCKACGASYALSELCTVIAELSGTRRSIADRLAHLAQRVRQLKPAAVEVKRDLLLVAKSHADLAAQVKLAPAPWNACIAAVQMIETMAEVLAGASTQAREGAWSAELRHARPGTRGRTKHWTLTAMSQHLGHGGYSQQQIADIVFDDAGGSDEARLERVRHRLTDADCRSILPEPPDAPETAEKPGNK